jgi:hypothetical protein
VSEVQILPGALLISLQIEGIRKRFGTPPKRLYTNYYTNAALSQCIIHRASGNAAHVGQDVTIDVEGEAHVTMP